MLEQHKDKTKGTARRQTVSRRKFEACSRTTRYFLHSSLAVVINGPHTETESSPENQNGAREGATVGRDLFTVLPELGASSHLPSSAPIQCPTRLAGFGSPAPLILTRELEATWSVSLGEKHWVKGLVCGPYASCGANTQHSTKSACCWRF